MTVLYKVTSKAIDAGGNVVVDVSFWDDASPATVYTDRTNAVDLTDAYLADWAARRYKAFATGAASAAAITANADLPAIPKVDPATMAALIAAEKKFRASMERAQVVATGDAQALADYDDLVAARVAVFGK